MFYLLKIGATYLAVSCLFEALDLTRQGFSKPIFILYESFEDELETCLEHNWTLQIQSLERAKKLSELSEKQDKTTKVHLKVDTGLARYGVACEKAAQLYLEIAKIPHLELEGIMTHLAQSDEPDKSYAQLQDQKFQKVMDDLKTKNITFQQPVVALNFLGLNACYSCNNYRQTNKKSSNYFFHCL